jgi:SAM-dependent methyltransferase
MLQVKHEGEVIDQKSNYKVINCKNCGFIHINPLPSEEELSIIYREDYYSKEKPDYIEKYKEDSEWWNLIYNYRFDLYELYFNPRTSKILDIGSGPGHFLKIGKDRGWESKGLEPNIDAAKYSKSIGLDIIEEFYTKDLSETVGKFDVINLGEVLEHLRDPFNFILQLKNNLNKNGILSIIVPNDFNPFQLILNQSYDYNAWWLAPPYHINYFTFNSLSKLLEKAGFKIVNKESTFPIDLFLLMGENYIENSTLGRESHKKRMEFEIKMLNSGNSNLLRGLYQKMAELNIGREIFICAKKI